MMPQALWLVGLPFGAATLVFILRRFWIGALIAAFIALFLAWLAITVPTGIVFSLLGRTVELDRFSQFALFLLFVTTALLLIAQIFLTVSYSRRLRAFAADTHQVGRVFYPAALVILGFFVAASLSRHLGITAILIEVAAIIMVFVIQTERLESTRASLRFLVLASLATPLLLLAAWQVDSVQLSDRVISAQIAERVALLVGGGFAIWLAIVPFHSWLTSTASEALPPTAAFVLIAFPVVAILTFTQVLSDWPWLTGTSFLIRGIITAGLFTALVGGILAGFQRGFDELLGYAALFNLACIVSLLGVGGDEAIITVMFGLVVRSLALVLVAISMSTIKLIRAQAGFSQVGAVAYQMPIATTGLILGGLTLAGVPFTAGFAPYWQLLQSMAATQGWGALVLFAGSLGVAIGYLRGLRAALAPTSVETKKEQMEAVLEVDLQEPTGLLVLIVFLITIILVLGLYPGLLLDLLRPFAGELSLPLW